MPTYNVYASVRFGQIDSAEFLGQCHGIGCAEVQKRWRLTQTRMMLLLGLFLQMVGLAGLVVYNYMAGAYTTDICATIYLQKGAIRPDTRGCYRAQFPLVLDPLESWAGDARWLQTIPL